MPHHAKASLWTIEHSRRWFTHCDQCSKWRLVADYYEIYPPIGSKGDEAGWWWACSWCLLIIVNDMLDDTMKQVDVFMQQREDAPTPCKRVSVCCKKPPPTTPPYKAAGLCSACWRYTEFMCSQHAGEWPDPTGECLEQENLDGA